MRIQEIVKRVNSDLAYEYIRENILSGKFQPGSALMTELLAAEIGVSRTPIRDALRKLEADGLVSIQAHLGARVKLIEYNEFREMCDFRLALESHAAGLAAANRRDFDLNELEVALNSMRRLTLAINKIDKESELIQELMRQDICFHVAVINASGNGLLKREILRLHVINRVVIGPNRSDENQHQLAQKSDGNVHRNEVIHDHEEIFKAIADKNVVAAKQAMERHIQDIIDNRLSKFAFAQGQTIGRELTSEELAYHP